MSTGPEEEARRAEREANERRLERDFMAATEGGKKPYVILKEREPEGTEVTGYKENDEAERAAAELAAIGESLRAGAAQLGEMFANVADAVRSGGLVRPTWTDEERDAYEAEQYERKQQVIREVSEIIAGHFTGDKVFASNIRAMAEVIATDLMLREKLQY